jgi:hypothetical protein
MKSCKQGSNAHSRTDDNSKIDEERREDDQFIRSFDPLNNSTKEPARPAIDQGINESGDRRHGMEPAGCAATDVSFLVLPKGATATNSYDKKTEQHRE